MTTEGLLLIREFERCSLVAYQDQGRRWTIGWGRAHGVSPRDTCSQSQADAWFLEDVLDTEEVLNASRLPPLNDNQFSALVSFCYNVGFGIKGRRDGFLFVRAGGPSALLKRLREQDFEAAGAEFLRWDHVGGAKSAGLRRRRLAEQALFFKAPDSAATGVNHGKD